MKNLLLLVLSCCMFTVSAQPIFELESKKLSSFDLITEIASDKIEEVTTSITYYETETEAFMFTRIDDKVMMTKVINVIDNVEGLYDNYVYIETFDSVENTSVILLLPKVITDHFLLIFVQPDKKIAIRCQIQKSIT